MSNTIYSNKLFNGIKLVSSPCGSGKTTSTCDYIRDHQFYSNHVYVAPTIKLLNQTEAMLKDRDIYNITKINSVDHPMGVKSEIIQYLNQASHEGEILLITLKSYLDLSYFHKKENWTVIIDEAPAVDCYYTFDLTNNNSYLKNLLEIKEIIKPGMGILQAKKKSELKKRIESKDVIDDQFKDLFRNILSKNYDVFCDVKSWNDLIDGDTKDPANNTNRVYILAMLNPTKFENAVILGANLENTIMYEYYSRYYDIDFVEHEEIKKGLKFSAHYCSENTRSARKIDYYYYFEKESFSKNLRDKEVPGKNCKVIELIEQAILKEPVFSESKTLLIENNNYGGLLDEKKEIFNRGEVINYGLNAYQHLNSFVFLAALNREPKHSQMLDSLGIDRHYVIRATQYEAIYQGVMRTSLRNYNATEEINVFVPTLQEVKYLIDIFGPNNTVRKLGEENYKKTLIPLTNNEKNLRCERNYRKKAIFTEEEYASKRLPSFLRVYNNSHVLNANVPTNSRKAIVGPNGLQINTKLEYTLTFEESAKSIKMREFAQQNLTPVDTNELLRMESRVPINNKTENYLIIPSAFDFSRSEGFRNYQNFIQAWMLILDFDGGEYSIKDFEHQFWFSPNKYDKLSFAICNSFSRCENNPNKFRVFLYFREPAVIVEEFRAVYTDIKQKIESVTKNHHLDPQSGNPTQPFFTPCINRAHKDYAYFESYGVNARDLEIYGIRPSMYLRTSKSPNFYPDRFVRTEEEIAKQNKGYTQEEIDSNLKKIKESVTSLSEGRHWPFFKAGLNMRALGLDFYEIKSHLEVIEKQIGKTKYKWTKGAMANLMHSKYANWKYRG